MRTIAVLNQKGGVGKTTTVANTAAALAMAGSKVVAIDLDPQAHLTIHLGLEPQSIEAGSYRVLMQSGRFDEQILLVRPNLWLLPANINLVGAESELVSVVGRETILREAILPSEDKFDYCFIDCAPSLGLLTLNALAAAEEVLIPLQPHFLALQGFGQLLQTVELVNKRINPTLKVKGILLCMFDSRASLPNEVKADIEQFLSNARGTDSAWSEARILPTFIRRNIKLAEAPSYGKTIFEYEQNCHGTEDYKKVAEFVDAQFQPPVQTEVPQPVTASESEDESHNPSPIMEQTEPSDSNETQDPSTASEKPLSQSDTQASPQRDPESNETNDTQPTPPIEIRSIPPSDSQISTELSRIPRGPDQPETENVEL
jgi:chromosome partitioning protein